jgi:hypothetical protein
MKAELADYILCLSESLAHTNRRVHRDEQTDGQTRKEDGARRFLTFRVGTFRRAAASNILHSESIPIFQLRAFRI